ncbi:acyl-CoA dehydrogenase family protein [Spongisporangium articulatum]|uniref:Acyl-CoA dehydrogenase family protein n=1 Tax=Spongisporangium articulatum TaxID=3362603 RepID=A0ABW8AV95_9ACTN
MGATRTPEQEKLTRQLREYFAGLMTPERREALRPTSDTDGDYGDGEAYRDTVRQMGADGWLVLNWPVEHGGQGKGAVEALIFSDEAARAGAPVPFLTLNTIGPTIMRFGNAQQRELLPRIAEGRVHFAIGYSEPGAGTDLASLRTRADRDGDEYVVNGQKMWTSLIQYADYVWLACRTDQAAAKHRGLSMLVIPTTAQGFSWTPVRTLPGLTTSATYYQDVRVPLTALVGSENQGWALITNQLNHERVALTPSAPLEQLLDDVRAWAVGTRTSSGARVADAEWVQVHLARARAEVEVLRLLNEDVAQRADRGEALGPAEASMNKVYGTELAPRVCRLLMEVLGAAGPVRRGSPGEVLQGRVERTHRTALVLTFGGGTNEVQRDIVAATALRLPVGAR